MRNFFSLVLSFFIILATVPCVSLFYKDEIRTKSEDISVQATSATDRTSEMSTPVFAEKSDKVNVLIHTTQKVQTVSHEFYLISVLAKEIAIDSPTEALKAQAVCIETFLRRTKALLKEEKYDISDDPSVHQSFLTEKALKEFWGENYNKNYKRLAKVVQSVWGQFMTYEGEPILAAYHSSNAGATESAENYWNGKAYSYLTSVSSPGDSLSPYYSQQAVFSPKELKKKLLTLKDKSFSFASSPSDWIGDAAATPAGTVQQIELGGARLSGREVREALGLKSAVFTLTYKNGNFVFTVSGYGHGVGLSQEGAKYLAKLGFHYEQILFHYYKGIEIDSENKL